MNDDACIEPLEDRLASLKAQIAELKSDRARDGERRVLETQAGYVIVQLDELRARYAVARKA